MTRRPSEHDVIRDATVSIRSVRPVVEHLRARAVDPSSVLNEAGIDARVLDDPDGRVAHRAAVEVWRLAEDITDDPSSFGLHVAQTTRPQQFELVHFVYAHSATVGEGIARLIEFYSLSHDATRLETVPHEGHVLVRHVLPGGAAAPRHIVEWILTTLVLAARHATGDESLSPVAVLLRHRAPEDTSEHENMFSAPTHFEASDNGLLLDDAFLATPHVGADAALLALLERHAAELMGRLDAVHSFADRVRTMIAKGLRSGDVSAEALAAALHISVRTFARRLADEGVSHRALLDEVRATLAERYLCDDDLSITDAAYLLGFAEPSTFHRAFKRWNGVAPAEFRRERR